MAGILRFFYYAPISVFGKIEVAFSIITGYLNTFVLSSPLEIFEDGNVCFGLLLETISSLFRISLQEEKKRKNDKNNTLNQ